MDSILTSIKKSIGVMPDYTIFDGDIIMYINNALFNLTQIGVGPEEGFVIVDDQSKWSDFLGDSKDLEAAKTYVSIKTKLVFDPPVNTSHIEALQRMADECYERLSYNAETKEV